MATTLPSNCALSPEQLTNAREWLLECDWPDMEAEDIEDLTDAEVVTAIKRHFDGGLNGFLQHEF